MSFGPFVLSHPIARSRAEQAVRLAPDGFVVTIKEKTRNSEANAAMWVRLQAFSDQLLWPVNGKMERLSPEEWKDLTTAAFRQEQNRVTPGLTGGFVMLGQHTSKFTQREMSDFITFLDATAADRGVVIPEEQMA